MMVDRVLTRLQAENPDLTIDRIDVVANPLTALKQGIRMIPAMNAGTSLLSGIWLSEKQIRTFIDRVKQDQTGKG